MESEFRDAACAAGLAAMIGEPARARMLYALMDGCARTSTELSTLAETGASTASGHLSRLKAAGLVTLQAQGKHRYYSLAGPEVAAVLESLQVLAGGALPAFIPRTPPGLRAARSCYDHLAGALGVALHDRLHELGWLRNSDAGGAGDYALTIDGAEGLARIGLDVQAARGRRRRFACACLDWSERRPHLAGALGASLLAFALSSGWLIRDLDSRSLSLTGRGERQFKARFEIEP